MHQNSTALVEHFFRHEYARSIAYLRKKFGAIHLELIEDAIQDTLIKAMNAWVYHKTPDNPTAWVIKVASNRMVDLLKRQKKSIAFDSAQLNPSLTPHQNVQLEEELKDDQLKMIFACCDECLSEKSQLILTLKLMGGFSIGEISSALLLKEEAVAKAFTRAKERLKRNDFILLSPSLLAGKKRLDQVLKVIYLLFNEGYKTTSGDELIKSDISYEAIRLTNFLLESQHYNLAKVNALMALMLFQSSRFKSRLKNDGSLISIDLQDRSSWDQRLIERGMFFLVEASKGNHLSEYHVQASIAAYHSTAKSYGDTDWENILKLYDYQVQHFPGPIAALNRIVAYAKIHGSEKALKELKILKGIDFLNNYYLYYAIRGKLQTEIQHYEEASYSLKEAIRLTENNIEKKYLTDQLEEISLNETTSH
jgi:RNA polymerase sigma factor (sigma-70 family)